MKRIYLCSDSGPYVWWQEANDTYPRDGFGVFGEVVEVEEVPDDLWAAYEEARDAADIAERRLDEYLAAHRPPPSTFGA